MHKFASILFLFISTVTQAQPDNNFRKVNKASPGAIFGATFYQNGKMNLYDIRYLKLEITVQPQSRLITGICSYNVFVNQPLDTFAIEFKQTMLLDSVYVNNSKQAFTRSNDHIYIGFTPVINAGSEMNLKFYYGGMVSGGIFAGLDATTGLQYTATLSESFQAREWFPAKQLLNDKIDSSDIWITTGAAFKAGSNGLLKQVIDLPGNLKQYRWSCRYPLNYYMPSIAVGNYMEYNNYAKPVAVAPDSILIQNFLVDNPAYFNNNKNLIDKTPRYLEKLSELYGLYPFYKEKYGHAQAFIGGGMEHATMTTIQSFEEHLVAHELAHQWFGDNVTCATWNDIWLNESFATYSEVLMQEKLPPLFPTTAAAQMSSWHQRIMSVIGGSVYVPLSESFNEARIFDYRLSYAKGAAVIHSLRFQMQSDTLFFKTLKTYQQQFRNSFATTNDFKQVAEQVTGKNLNEFFSQWIYGEGFPTYGVTYSKQGTDTLVLAIDQTTSMPAITPLFKGLMEYKVLSAQGDTIIKLDQTINNQTFKIYYTKNPTGVEVDPNNWIINRVSTIVPGINTITFENPGIRISPNPVRSTLNVRSTNNSYETLQIIDVQGRAVQTNALLRGATTYSIPITLPPGLYFVRLIGKKGNLTEKIIVSR
jgi:aminopeptidase N